MAFFIYSQILHENVYKYIMEKELIEKFKDISLLIGNTPLIEIKAKYNEEIIFVRAKLEWYNLSGSIKDRPAFEIIKNAYVRGELKQGQTICETTSGNMGISICAIANMLGNPVVICMPKFMSRERQELLKLYGAKLELTENFDEAFKRGEEYKKEGAYLSYQFENMSNLKAHYQSTAKEIYKRIKDIRAFVSGVGTGGTIMGVGEFLKEKCNSKIIAIDPDESKLLQFGKSQGHHKIQGLSDEIIPKLYNQKLIDKIISIKSNDAIAMARKLCQELGLCVGISGGANFLGCILSGINGSVTVFADDNKKYLSTDLAKAVESEMVEQIELIDYKVL